ncbi:MAG: cytochrome c oxidase, subunit II [halophilic archaeon J07HB67]|jgi:cytochrome c oxidase, subunit II|nr:MAG: cytochrome c oxidase, subunit II [halophilic archaeon J07HB67]
MTETRLGRLVRLVAVGAFAAVLFAAPVAAQTSTTQQLIDGLNARLLWVGVPITVLVEAILVYAVFKFRGNDDPKKTRENRRLEITWTVATAIILLFVGVASYGVLANEDVTYSQPEAAGDGVEVEAVAYQWNWKMNYPEQNVSQLSARDVELGVVEEKDLSGPLIVAPVDEPLYITTTSEDVIHAVHVPEMGLKQDAVPGQNNTIRTTPLETGVFQGYCAEYCGQGHSKMYFSVVVVDQQTYDEFLERQSSDGDDAA